MDLDIYVSWHDMTKDEKAAQITGFSDAPQHGYLRCSWPAMSFLRDTCAKLGGVIPLVGYHKYAIAANGDDAQVTSEVLDELKHWRTLWQVEAVSVQNNDFAPTFDSEYDKEFYVHKLTNAAAMVDFIEAKYNEGKTGLTICYS